MNLNEFKFIVLPGSNPDPKYLDYYENAYSCWHRVWDETLKEFDSSKHLYSDDFTRQTEINCIFHRSKCVALLFSRVTNFVSETSRNDSYFKLWSEDEFKKLLKDGLEILVISNTTVAKEWRGENSPIPLKDLIVYLTIHRGLTSGASAMTAITRNTRGVDKLVERFGAIILKKDVPNYNSEDLVNLSVFYKKETTEGTNPEVTRLGRKLMSEAIITTEQKVYTKKAA